MNKTNNLDNNIKELRRMMENRRRALKEFDSKPEAEKRRLTAEGLNPHEPVEVRKRKQDKIIIEVRTELRKKMTDEEWKDFEKLGYFLTSEELKDRIIRR